MPQPKLQRSIDILLVESDPAVAEVIRQAVLKVCPTCFLQRVARPHEAEPYFEAKAPSGPQRRLNPSLVLIDLQDPKSSEAPELMQWLRGHERTKHVPIVVLGWADGADSVRRAYDLGASSYLIKPAEEARLAETVAAAAAYWTSFNHPPE